MAKESSQKRQARGPEKARVHIEYEVHKPSGIVKRELPFVVGVLADLSGKASKPEFRLRQPIKVEGDVANALQAIKPRLKFEVKDKITKDGGRLPISIEITDMSGFAPQNVIAQVAPLAKLFALRQHLVGLRSRAEGNNDLEPLLNEVLQNTELRERLKLEVKAKAKAQEEKR